MGAEVPGVFGTCDWKGAVDRSTRKSGEGGGGSQRGLAGWWGIFFRVFEVFVVGGGVVVVVVVVIYLAEVEVVEDDAEEVGAGFAEEGDGVDDVFARGFFSADDEDNTVYAALEAGGFAEAEDWRGIEDDLIVLAA